jgi:hypothetical protein
MLRSGKPRGLRHQEPEDNASSITMSVSPSKRPRGRLRDPSGSKKPRTALAYKTSDPAIVSTTTPIIAMPSSSSLRVLRSAASLDHTSSNNTKKRKRTLLEEVPTDFRGVCEGCRRRSYHGENLDEAVIICYKCKKDWHPLCMATKGTKSLVVPGQWKCCNCSEMVKLQPLQPAYTDNTEAEVTLGRHARDTTYETDLDDFTEELDMPRITDDYGDLVNFSKTTVIQAQEAYEEAEDILNNVLTERETCRERLNKLKLGIERCGNGLEEYRRQFDSDSVQPGDGDSEHSTSHRLALGICGDGDWIGNMLAKIDLIRDKERDLTGRLKSLRADMEIKMAILKRLEQKRSMVSTCLQTSCREFEKLWSKIMEDHCEDSGSVSESTMEDSVTEDVSPNGIARGIERLDEENQQHMIENSNSKDDGGQMRGPSRLSETAEEFELPQIPLRTEAIQILHKPSDTANGTSLQETLPRPSNTTIHIPSSDLGEGRNQRQNVSLATSISKESDQLCTPENCRRTQDPLTPTFVSISEDLAPSSEDLDRSNSSEPSSSSVVPEDTTIITEHQHSIPAEADSTPTSSGYENVFGSELPPSVLGPSCSQSPANAMRNNIVPPPITSFSLTDDAPQSSVLQSPIPLCDLTASEAGTRNHFATGPVWNPCPFFQERIGSDLVNGQDNTKIPTLSGVITRGDLRTLVNAGYLLANAIINKYLKCLTQHSNARSENVPDSCRKIAMIGSMDHIPPGLLKSLASFFAIYIPIQIPNNHWILAVLYPGSFGQQGRSEVYDSHKHWTSTSMTTEDVSYFLEYRLGDEYSPRDWIQSTQQRSRPQLRGADSGLYVLANAKSIALGLDMVELGSDAQSKTLRWQVAQELVSESIVGEF